MKFSCKVFHQRSGGWMSILLHRLILERGLKITQDAVKTEKNITYEREMDTAIGEVDSGRAQICFLLNPVSVETVAEMAMGGEILPQKSTDFFPETDERYHDVPLERLKLKTKRGQKNRNHL